ncbi:o-succinylbenzoate synthase [Planosporangium thailandense]|uniref:o-succinylbenzoate synthase n=1 Tax=Planosporangium thailandense TaxID=765197 RepID=A0ABX0Y7Z3_9ACTN|nr:o-succinylbenzoate synthase [Planosporangium thailandense]
MTITEVTLAVVRLDLVHGFETSSHRKNHLDHILVRATATDGTRQLVGWGECASPSDPFYCGETTESCWQILGEYLVPMLLGRPWGSVDEASRLTAKVSGNHFARAGLEMACWDLLAQARDVPLVDLLGLRTADRVEAGVSLGIEPSIDALMEQVARHVGDGYRRVKLKIRPGWDLEPVRAVRAAFPALALQVDANAAYTTAEIDRLVALDGYGLLMVEQPFAADDLLAHAALARRAETPVCLDEAITSVAVLRSALALRACSIVNVKVSRLGGVGPAIAVHDVCRDAGVPVWCGGMHEFGVGRAVNLAVASLPGFTLPSDVSGSDKYYRADIVTPPIRAEHGTVAVPRSRPGIGVTVDETMLKDHTLRTRTLQDGSRR